MFKAAIRMTTSHSPDQLRALLPATKQVLFRAVEIDAAASFHREGVKAETIDSQLRQLVPLGRQDNCGA